MDEVADGDLGAAGTAADRGDDLGEVQVQLLLLHVSLGGVERRLGGVTRSERFLEVLRTDRVGPAEGLVAAVLGVGVTQLRFGDLYPGDRLVVVGLVRPRVNLEEYFTLVYLGPVL